jgi:hypothetical protein
MEFIDENNSSICVVCLDSIDFTLNNYCVTSCNHSFHLNCLLLTKNNCPICKIELINDEENINNNNYNDNDEENNLYQDIYDDNLTLYELIIQITNNIIDSEIKTMLIELNNNLLSEKQINYFVNNFNDYVYAYDSTYQLSLDLCSKFLKLKHALIDKYDYLKKVYEEDIYEEE